MPKKQSAFFDMVRVFFPCIYDIKYMMKSCRNLKGGLQELADDLEVKLSTRFHLTILRWRVLDHNIKQAVTAY